jgi:hypothetical protein
MGDRMTRSGVRVVHLKLFRIESKEAGMACVLAMPFPFPLYKKNK